MYNWEVSGKKQQKKTKKTGTVVLHTDERVDLSFDRLTKPQHVFSREEDKQEGTDETAPASAATKFPLMTEATVQALEKRMGFSGLLPCQAQCYRGIFRGRDVILHSRTGSGKTLAYALPIIERHLLGSESEESHKTRGPFMLIFVFSHELAFQTRSVLQKIYKSLAIGVAGMDDVVSKPCDIIIGTVASIDDAIRGSKKVTRTPKRQREETEADSDGASDVSSSSDDDDDNAFEVEEKVRTVDPSHVRAIVVDEVDNTLGPRYSKTGRRMRNLLKTVRRANGALSDSLMTDFHSHHYVLCGATVPNWVIKAGFLGVKKYYYQLIAVGDEKLPKQLETYAAACPAQEKVTVAAHILQTLKLGRVVVFGTNKQLVSLETTMKTPVPEDKASKKHSGVIVRALLPKDDEADRIRAIEEFNSHTANVLLCTDVAARGIDFVDVNMVLMLSLPGHNMAAEVFVHRSGRTARVGKPGKCLLLFDPTNEQMTVDSVIKYTHTTFRRMPEIESLIASRIAPGRAAVKAAKAGKASSDASMVKFRLRVRGAFSAGTASITPEDVLAKSVDDSTRDKIVGLKHPDESDTRTLEFEFPMALSHELKAQLWKYDLKEIS